MKQLLNIVWTIILIVSLLSLLTNGQIVKNRVKTTTDLMRIHSLKYAIARATVTGANSVCRTCVGSCRECSTTHASVFKSPKEFRFAYSRWPNYMTFHLIRPEIINLIEFHLWDGDARYHTYTLEYSLDGSNWIALRTNARGESYQMIQTGQDIELQWLRIRGKSSRNQDIVLYSLSIDYII